MITAGIWVLEGPSLGWMYIDYMGATLERISTRSMAFHVDFDSFWRSRRPARALRGRRAAAARARSIRVTRARARGLPSRAAWSIPGRLTSFVNRASPRARAWPSIRGAGRPTTARGRRPLVERVLLDDHPGLRVATLDLLLGADQACQVAIASSIRR